MKQRQIDGEKQYGECQEGELMYRPFDENDCDHADAHSGQAGEPDAESAHSMSCWFGGLLEDPLDDTETSEREDYSDFDESVLFPFPEEAGDGTKCKMENFDER
jgi:hypothetical protein